MAKKYSRRRPVHPEVLAGLKERWGISDNDEAAKWLRAHDPAAKRPAQKASTGRRKGRSKF